MLNGRNGHGKGFAKRTQPGSLPLVMNTQLKELPVGIRIVLIEDEPSHARLTEITLRHVGVTNEIMKIEDGMEALEFLTSEGRYAGQDLPMPMVVLLDLNLPGVTGHEILERMRHSNGARDVPVIVVTSSDDPEDKDRCYALGCNGYLVKPPEGRTFLNAFHKAGLC